MLRHITCISVRYLQGLVNDVTKLFERIGIQYRYTPFSATNQKRRRAVINIRITQIKAHDAHRLSYQASASYRLSIPSLVSYTSHTVQERKSEAWTNHQRKMYVLRISLPGDAWSLSANGNER